MDKNEALDILRDGHTIWATDYAKEVCATRGVEWSDSLVQRYETDRSHENPKYNLTMKSEYEDTDGVYSLELSLYCAKAFGVADAGSYLSGRGFRAQAYSRAIQKKMEEGHINSETG